MDPYFQCDFPPSEFHQRRTNVLNALGPQAVAVIQGAPATGAYDRFRQTNDFFYLCGVEVPHACLLLDGRSGLTTLYVPPRDAKHERSEGAQINSSDQDTAMRLTGVQRVRPPASLLADLADVPHLHVPFSAGEGRQACRDVIEYAARLRQADPFDARPGAEEHFRNRIHTHLPQITFHDLSPFLDRLRVIKSHRELTLMRKAGALSALAVCEAMRNTQPQMFEYELAALADYLFLKNAARGAGYSPIVACGKNIWNAHYCRNNCLLQSGELVLMDYAPDVGGYTSDIGRMWPINGRYSDEQRELYAFIVAYHKTLLNTLRPGITADQAMDDAAALMLPVVEKTRWSRSEFAAAARRTLDFRGHCSHAVGMAVHDVGNYQLEPLAPGVVFALDPQLWAPELELYIRVEDTVAITENGVEVLTSAAPLDLPDVERLVGVAKFPAPVV